MKLLANKMYGKQKQCAWSSIELYNKYWGYGSQLVRKHVYLAGNFLGHRYDCTPYWGLRVNFRIPGLHGKHLNLLNLILWMRKRKMN